MKNIKEVNGYSVGEIKASKYLRVVLRKKDDNVIEDIKIIGDFFAFPESAVDSLEDDLKGKTLEEALNIVEGYDVIFTGITKEDLKNAIKQAFKGGKNL
ncbi:MAG: hypothetical protein DRN30_02330 [Thermoplasmata archaeon]|nr:hypothetical protein [Euryarchaeota archaeon]RLF66338.1 MAG: hypothetical protein DRN30_02330 [Thermoplasmata archaeon]